MKSTQSDREDVVMDMTVRNNTYSGPNYRSAKAERKAVALNRRDGVVAALFAVLIVILPALWAIHSFTPGVDGCRTTQTWCSTSSSAVK